MPLGISGLRHWRAFTLVEAMVTMALLVAFFAVAAGMYFQGQSAFDRQDARSQTLHDEVSATQILSQVTQRVRVPEWANVETTFVTDGNQRIVLYLDGQKSNRVRVTTGGGVLTVSTPTGEWSWKHLSGISADWWNVQDRIVGLVVAWSGTSGPTTLHLPWGSQPL